MYVDKLPDFGAIKLPLVTSMQLSLSFFSNVPYHCTIKISYNVLLYACVFLEC